MRYEPYKTRQILLCCTYERGFFPYPFLLETSNSLIIDIRSTVCHNPASRLKNYHLQKKQTRQQGSRAALFFASITKDR